jgi:hypothetical protein
MAERDRRGRGRDRNRLRFCHFHRQATRKSGSNDQQTCVHRLHVNISTLK